MVLCNTIIIFLVYTLEPYLWIKSMSVLQRRFDNPRVYLLAGIGYYLITVVKQIIVFYHFPEMFNTVMNGLMLVYMFGMTFFLFKSELYKKIISIGMYCFLTFVTELSFIAFSMYFFHCTLNELAAIGWLNTCATIMSKIMLALGEGTEKVPSYEKSIINLIF